MAKKQAAKKATAKKAAKKAAPKKTTKQTPEQLNEFGLTTGQIESINQHLLDKDLRQIVPLVNNKLPNHRTAEVLAILQGMQAHQVFNHEVMAALVEVSSEQSQDGPSEN